jgi:hypothetical protein
VEPYFQCVGESREPELFEGFVERVFHWGAFP